MSIQLISVPAGFIALSSRVELTSSQSSKLVATTMTATFLGVWPVPRRSCRARTSFSFLRPGISSVTSRTRKGEKVKATKRARAVLKMMLSMWRTCGFVVLNFWTMATITVIWVSGLRAKGSRPRPGKKRYKGEEGGNSQSGRQHSTRA